MGGLEQRVDEREGGVPGDDDEKSGEDEYDDEWGDPHHLALAEEGDELAEYLKTVAQFVYRHNRGDEHDGENYQWQILVQNAWFLVWDLFRGRNSERARNYARGLLPRHWFVVAWRSFFGWT